MTEQAAKFPKGRRLVNLVGFLVLMVGAAAIAVMLILSKPELVPAEPVERIWNIQSLSVAPGTHQPNMEVFGEIAAGRTAEMRALVQGQVAAVGDYFHNGAPVRKGDMLVEIDRFEFETAIAQLKAQIVEARARIAEAEAKTASETASLKQDREILDLLQKDLDRTEDLHGRGNISDKALDQARLELTRQAQTVARREAAAKTEAARRDQQQAALDRLQVELQRAERDLERTRLTAPFDGFLSEVNAELGQRVNVNERLARLVGVGALEARGHLSDTQYGRLLSDGGLEDRPAEVIWDVGSERIAYKARIARITAEIRPETGGVTFYALIDSSGLDIPIRPGAFVRVILPDRSFENAVRLPTEALHDEDHVFVVGDEDRLQRRDVAVLARAGDDVIVSGDLKAGDHVVLTRFNEIGTGVLVRETQVANQ